MGSYFLQDYLEVPDGAQLYYQVQGEGEHTIVLCDGLGCDGFAWKYLLPQLKQHHRVIRWHYRGHGLSSMPKDPDRIGMLYTCEDLNRVLDAAGVEKAVLFGHSMGVQVALEFHRLFAQRVTGLVLICGSYGNPLDTFHDNTYLKTAFPYVKQTVERFPAASARFTSVFMKTELALEIALRMELNRELVQRQDLIPYFDHLAKMSPLAFVRTLDSLAQHTCFDHLPRVDVPALVIGGEGDKFTPVRLSKRMAECIPGAEFMLVPFATHTAPLEQPQLVGQRVDRFLSSRIVGEQRQAPAAPVRKKRKTLSRKKKPRPPAARS